MLPKYFATIGIAIVLVTSARAFADEPDKKIAISDTSASSHEWSISGQATVLTQYYPSFSSPIEPFDYNTSKFNSLPSNGGDATTVDMTLFAGLRAWGGELWINTEIDQGFGVGNTFGIAGFPSGEAYKVGATDPYLRIPRLFYRKTINLGDELKIYSPSTNQMEGYISPDNIIVTVGKFSIVDVFDTNSYAHDPRSDFFNWSIVDSGAFDYAGDAWGFSQGGSFEWTHSNWTLRGGVFALSTVPSSVYIDTTFKQYEMVGELEERYSIRGHPGKMKLLGYVNKGRMGSYQDAIRQAQASGGTPDTTSVRSFQSQPGFAVNLEQEVSSSMGIFARASQNEGKYETFDFTDINQSVAAGVSLKGNNWGRHDDTFGLAVVANGLSDDARNYFAAGGMGILIGDGQLPHYGMEKIMETYYSYAVRAIDHLMLTLNYQYVTNPAYNQDRGPISIFGLRLHMEL